MPFRHFHSFPRLGWTSRLNRKPSHQEITAWHRTPQHMPFGRRSTKKPLNSLRLDGPYFGPRHCSSAPPCRVLDLIIQNWQTEFPALPRSLKLKAELVAAKFCLAPGSLGTLSFVSQHPIPTKAQSCLYNQPRRSETSPLSLQSTTTHHTELLPQLQCRSPFASVYTRISNGVKGFKRIFKGRQLLAARPRSTKILAGGEREREMAAIMQGLDISGVSRTRRTESAPTTRSRALSGATHRLLRSRTCHLCMCRRSRAATSMSLNWLGLVMKTMRRLRTMKRTELSSSTSTPSPASPKSYATPSPSRRALRLVPLPALPPSPRLPSSSPPTLPPTPTARNTSLTPWMSMRRSRPSSPRWHTHP
ncbi:hypothetical protein B0H10DRAFT_695936 [Mycena sp. CBHHK59/15]|nr:hypothetical protein B0H10DRAFT_695936 [Mycena sp. CBHHK59/15]